MLSPACRKSLERKTVNDRKKQHGRAKTVSEPLEVPHLNKEKSQGPLRWKQRNQQISVIDAVHMKNLGWNESEDSS